MVKYKGVLPPLHEAQKTVAESEARWKVLCAGRRFGKTRLGVQMCMENALEGKRAWWVAPTFAIARVGWRAIEAAAMSFPAKIRPKVSIANMEVHFENGGFIAAKSADNPQRLRGEGLDFLVMDEAAFVKPEVWREVLRPTLTERKGKGLFISTPMGMNNWFYDLWQNAQDDENWETFRFSTLDNPAIDPDELEIAKKEVGSIIYTQEYLAEFVEDGQSLFKPHWLNYFQKSEDGLWVGGGGSWDPLELQHFGAVDIAVTTATSSDHTAIVDFAKHNDGTLFVNDVKQIKVEGPDLFPEIRNMYDRYNWSHVCIENVGLSKTVSQMLQREGYRVQEMKADKDKITKALPLSARMESGDVLLKAEAPWLPNLERELLAFPLGSHDDMVDAMALGAQEMQKKRVWEAY
jgi:predicted phage terminase large subunit-like protein